MRLLKPSYDGLTFRQELLADGDTMRYNEKWGGTIDFPPEKWGKWYQKWVEDPTGRFFYRYLYAGELSAPVGEAAYHFDEEFHCYIVDIIIKASFRERGFGRAGLSLLLRTAKENGVSCVYDNIAQDNAPALSLFTQAGFTEAWRGDDFIMLKKQL